MQRSVGRGANGTRRRGRLRRMLEVDPSTTLVGLQDDLRILRENSQSLPIPQFLSRSFCPPTRPLPSAGSSEMFQTQLDLAQPITLQRAATVSRIPGSAPPLPVTRVPPPITLTRAPPLATPTRAPPLATPTRAPPPATPIKVSVTSVRAPVRAPLVSAPPSGAPVRAPPVGIQSMIPIGQTPAADIQVILAPIL